jgi:hypothetical protein
MEVTEMSKALMMVMFGLLGILLLEVPAFSQDKWGTRGGSSGFPEIQRSTDVDDDEKRFDPIASKMGVPPKELRRRFKEERERNPGITHAQFVIAYMIGQNQSVDLTAKEVLDAIRAGKTVGQVLAATGMTGEQIRAERARIRSEVKRDKKYKDRDSFWRF